MEYPLKNLASHVSQQRETVELDDVDLKLLTLLTTDGRASLRSLATEVGLSSPAVSERINRLTQRGVIKNFTAAIDWDLLGYSSITYLSVKVQAGHDQGFVMEQLRNLANIDEVSIVTGTTDLLVRFRTKGLEDLRELLATGIWPIEGIGSTETSLALYTYDSPVSSLHRIAELQQTGR